MKRTILPPTLTAFMAGEAIRPIGYIGGRAVWPIAGGSDDPPADPPSSDAPPADPPTDPPGDTGKGFPANTPVAEMNADQRAAYWQDKAQKHEGRNKELLTITGGKFGDELKAVFDAAESARQASLSDAQRQTEEAARTAREEAAREFGPKSVRAAFNLLLGDMPQQERDAEIDLLDLGKFLNSDGEVDTDKVRRLAEKIAPADKGQGTQRRDYGQGKHTRGQSSGMAAGAEMYAAGRNKSTTNS